MIPALGLTRSNLGLRAARLGFPPDMASDRGAARVTVSGASKVLCARMSACVSTVSDASRAAASPRNRTAASTGAPMRVLTTVSVSLSPRSEAEPASPGRRRSSPSYRKARRMIGVLNGFGDTSRSHWATSLARWSK